MKPYITASEAAEIYKSHRANYFSPKAFREFLLDGALRELEKLRDKPYGATYPSNSDFQAWWHELESFDYAFWYWASDDRIVINRSVK